MGRGKLNRDEIEALKRNPYVTSVNEKSISYSRQFKQLFMERYLQGIGPTEIFLDAGFDVRALGSKRIERACARWKEAYESGSLEQAPAPPEKMTQLKERREIPGKKRRGQAGKSQVDICRKQAEVIKKLKAENELLRIVCGMTAAGRGKLPDEEQLCQAIEDVGGREEYRGCISVSLRSRRDIVRHLLQPMQEKTKRRTQNEAEENFNAGSVGSDGDRVADVCQLWTDRYGAAMGCIEEQNCHPTGQGFHIRRDVITARS